MLISEIMHQGVVTCDINDSIRKVSTIMKEEEIGALPVLEEGRPVGFVTDRDIIVTCVAEGQLLNEPVSHAMTEDVIFIEHDRDVSEAIAVMKENQVSRLLVIDDNEKPIGMVSLHDLAEATEETLMTGELLKAIKDH